MRSGAELSTYNTTSGSKCFGFGGILDSGFSD
jgi:hypothetical protein